MKRKILTLLSLASLVGLAACNNQQAPGTGADQQAASPPKPTGRWYTQAQVARGNLLFQENCASCHKPDASGTPEWRKRDARGILPPPPINGTAHAWHHPLSVLRRTVKRGGAPLGGTMPGFADKLTSDEIDDILAWVQSRWPEEVYRVWQERDAQASQLR